MIANLPVARPSPFMPIVIEGRRKASERLKRYHKIRPHLLPAQQDHYDKEMQRDLRRWFPPELIPWGQHFFPHYFTKPPSKMHVCMAESLQWKHAEVLTHEAIIAPRSGAKTTWTSKLYTLFCICNDLEKYILLIGDSSDQSHQNLAAVKKELEENQALAEAYPDACGVGARWNETYIVTRNDIKIEALGTRKKVRGRSHGPHRPGLIIIDDLENDDGVQSATQRERVVNWLNRALLPCGSDTCKTMFVGTALHPEDALQEIKVGKRLKGWKSRTFPALLREPTRQDLWDQWRILYRNQGVSQHRRAFLARQFYDRNRGSMDEGAEVLWPEKEPLYDLMKWREDKGENAFQAEKQGNAAATGATEFGSHLFGGSIWFDCWPDLTIKAMALDPSKGQSEKNDYSAYVWGGLAADGFIYVDADLERRDASKVVADGLRIYRQFVPQSFGIETVMFLQLFATIFELEARRLGIMLPIVPIQPHENKLVRIRQLTPYLTAGKIKFRAGSRGAELLVDQLKYFPTARHDDGPDALHMLMELLKALALDQQGGGHCDEDEYSPG